MDGLRELPRAWLITGGSGFLGRALVSRLRDHGCTVRVFDLEPGPPEWEQDEGIEVLQGDVADPEACARACHGIEAIIHAAAALPILRSRAKIYSVNVEGTRCLLEASVAAGVTSFAFISTTAVYGLHKVHPIDEDFELIPVGPYGESKIAAEQLCIAYRDRMHVPILRPKTFLGEGRLGVFEILFDWIHDGKRIPLIGPGHNKYQLLHVDDLIDASLLSVRHPGGSDTFNVAANSFGSLREDLTPLFEAAGHPPRFLPLPKQTTKGFLWLLDKARLSPLTKWHYGTMASDSYVEVEKAGHRLGWQPRYSNQDTLLAAYRWYHGHRDEVRRGGTGNTHTVGWDQRAIGFFKRFA